MDIISSPNSADSRKCNHIASFGPPRESPNVSESKSKFKSSWVKRGITKNEIHTVTISKYRQPLGFHDSTTTHRKRCISVMRRISYGFLENLLTPSPARHSSPL